MGKDMGYAPCTPSACMKVLEHYGIDCTGKKSGSYRKKSGSRKTGSHDAAEEECDK